MALILACFSLVVAQHVGVTAACDAAGLSKCSSDFSSSAGATSKVVKCAALLEYEKCFAAKSAGCPSQATSALSSNMVSTKAQLGCDGDNSATNPAAETSSSSEDTSNVVTEACDSAGIQQCVTAFSTGAASASDMSAKCKILGTYEDCLASKSAGCSAAQKNAFVGPVESAKSSLNCQEDELASSAFSLQPCVLAFALMLSAVFGVLIE